MRFRSIPRRIRVCFRSVQLRKMMRCEIRVLFPIELHLRSSSGGTMAAAGKHDGNVHLVRLRGEVVEGFGVGDPFLAPCGTFLSPHWKC